MITCIVTLIPDGRFQGREIENQELDQCHCNCRKAQSKRLNIWWKVDWSMKSWQGLDVVSASDPKAIDGNRVIQTNSRPPMWKHTVEKSNTNATNVIIHPLRQAIYGHILCLPLILSFLMKTVFFNEPLSLWTSHYTQCAIRSRDKSLVEDHNPDIATRGRSVCAIRMQTYLLLFFSCWPQVMSCLQPNRWSVPIAGAYLI